MGDERRYWAFLSYSHTDHVWADWLHGALETYHVPARLVGRPTRMGPAPRRFNPIFKDRQELAANANLREEVRRALAHSAFLIVICSPAAARSPWVEEEIVRFKVLHGEERVLAVIVGGAPRASFMPGREDQECFPAALRVRVGADGTLTAERADPIAADLRPAGDGRRLA
nr:toll/interleukin-1 receptor domain-containing protein [Caulobacteraceae bacterium]